MTILRLILLFQFLLFFSKIPFTSGDERAGLKPATTNFATPNGQDGFIRELLSGVKVPGDSENIHITTFNVPPIVESGGIVPVSVELNHPMEPDHYIQRLILIDENSVIKLKYIAKFSPQNTKASISTNVKLAKTTTLKAIAECNKHGRWLGISPEIKVGIGGCSSPLALPNRRIAGSIFRTRFERGAVDASAIKVKLSVKHPMDSGFVMDGQGNIHRQYPEFFLRTLKVLYGEEMAMELDLGPGLSNNPMIEFILKEGKGPLLKLEGINNEGQHFKSSISLKARLEEIF